MFLRLSQTGFLEHFLETYSNKEIVYIAFLYLLTVSLKRAIFTVNISANVPICYIFLCLRKWHNRFMYKRCLYLIVLYHKIVCNKFPVCLVYKNLKPAGTAVTIKFRLVSKKTTLQRGSWNSIIPKIFLLVFHCG